jgi:hypothetical protein
MKWITRKNIKVDRVACPWLIRRFIDPDAEFLFVDEGELLRTAAAEQAVPFDAPRIPEVRLNHRGNRCSFEAIVDDYHLNAPGLARLALIVRAADVKGQEEVAAEGLGVRTIAEGFAAMQSTDEERLARGFPVYDALYEYARRSEAESCGYPAPLVSIYSAGLLRSLGVGLLGVILAVYLSRAGVSTTSMGVVIGSVCWERARQQRG